MKTHDAELLKIKDLLHKNPKGMKITRIARELAMNRNAAAKFLEILLMTGQVEILEHGMSKIFILSSRTRIPTMLDLSNDFIIVLDREMKISQVNDNYLKFAGLKRENLLGKRPDITGLPVIGRQEIFDKIRNAHNGTDIRTEIKEIFRGVEFFYNVRLTPTIFNDGKRGTTIIIGDVTREKQNEISLRKMVEEILACIDDAVILVNSRTPAISFVNATAERMFDYKQEELVGKDPKVLLGVGGTIPGYYGNLHEAFGIRGYFETESLLRRKGGEEFPGTLHLRPIHDGTGGVASVVIVIRDMTSEKRSGGRRIRSDAGNLQIPLSLRIGTPDSDRYHPVI